MFKNSIKLLCICSLVIAAHTGCVFDPPAAIDGGLSEIAMEGDRFIPEPVRNAGLKPSNVFWLADSELVFVNWEKLILKYHYLSTGWQSECNICGPSQITREDDKWIVRCNTLNIPEGKQARVSRPPEVRVIERDLVNEDVFRIKLKIDYARGCPNVSPTATDFLPDGRTVFSNSFLADRDARYSLQALIPRRSGLVNPERFEGDAGESKLQVHVVRAGMPASVAPQRLKAVGGGAQPVQVWEWSAGEFEGKWGMNVSNKLRVTRVRVLKGKRNPVTNRFAPTDPMNPYVLPYRIEFGSLSCYASTNSDDGDIDLRRCRQSSDDRAGTSIVATPTYLNVSEQTPLTWRIVFDSREGFPAPLFVEGEELAIEFTLEVR